MRLNHLFMAICMLVLLLVGNHYIPMPGLINLLFNCLMIVLTIVYFMQFLNVMKDLLPAPKLFK